MNRIYKIILILLISNSSNAQLATTRQDSIFKVALKNLNENNLKYAYFSFSSVYMENQNSKLGKLALKKTDSLKTLLRKNLLNEIIGIWKLESIGSNWGMNAADQNNVEQFAEINKTKIKFYSRNKVSGKIESSKYQKIKFNDRTYDFCYFFELINDDNKLWRITLTEEKKLRITNSGEIKDNEISLIVCGNEDRIYRKL